MVTRSGPISQAVTKALKALTVDAGDVAVVALVQRYAALIDAAAPRAAYRRHLAALHAAVAVDGVDPGAAEHLAKIEEALAAHTVASDLGPKLLVALTALGMTPASRRAKGGPPSAAAPARNELEEFRARRAKRSR